LSIQAATCLIIQLLSQINKKEKQMRNQRRKKQIRKNEQKDDKIVRVRQINEQKKVSPLKKNKETQSSSAQSQLNTSSYLSDHLVIITKQNKKITDYLKPSETIKVHSVMTKITKVHKDEKKPKKISDYFNKPSEKIKQIQSSQAAAPSQLYATNISECYFSDSDYDDLIYSSSEDEKK
jgi:hypothetical protein